MSVMSEDEPSISIVLTPYKLYYQAKNFIPHSVFSKYAKAIRCQVGDEIYDEKMNGTIYAMFVFMNIDWDKSSIAQCSALCFDDPNGVGCKIEYPAPEITGFHLIQYPNRDGISMI